ncbi:rhombosortase [Thalassotalea sp. PLHSN55]|uniref:rhombosortase n=1 Tax=Thalassotalea sp. PLHSN55 TaxID=3435888 RepID=UPI003F87EB2A
MITFKNLPVKPTQYLPAAFVLILSALAFIFDSQLAASLIYKKSLIENGEYWRLFSSHFFHTNLNHLLLNLGGLLLLWSLHGHAYSVKNYSVLFIFSALVTGLGIYFFNPEINQYVGLSGVLHGIFVWGAIMDVLQKDKTGYLLLIGVWLKIAHEQYFGASEDTIALIAANVAVDAHLYGAIAGTIVAVITIILNKPNSPVGPQPSI